MLLGLSVLTLGAQTVEPAESTGSVPVKHWEFDYYNYSISGGQETLYMNFTMALRYNFDTPPVDVGGEVTVGHLSVLLLEEEGKSDFYHRS